MCLEVVYLLLSWICTVWLVDFTCLGVTSNGKVSMNERMAEGVNVCDNCGIDDTDFRVIYQLVLC